MQDFEGKVAVVTGAASGIGLALARRFGREGMRVVLADVEHTSLDHASATLADEIGADAVLAVPTDVRDERAVDALAAATFDRFGAAHVVCNNAGIGVGGLAWTVPADRWRWIVEVNLLSVAHGIRAFVPRMIEQGEGHVVNTASAAGILTGPGMSPYFATKHAVVALSESLHFDLGLVGAPVGVSVLCPEWVRTNIADSERNRPADVAAMDLFGSPTAPAAADTGDGAVPEADDDATATATTPTGRTVADTAAAGDSGGADEPSPLRAIVQGLVDGGIEPDDVAGMVVDGIRSGRFWILTHPTTIDHARARWDAIASDGRPQLWDLSPG